MNKLFYLRIAAANLKKNSKTYAPYLITCILTVLMFYAMDAITRNEGLSAIPGAATLQTVLAYAVVITGMFAVIFLFYTNSFLIKQRKKEFGLYQVLGMDKRNLAKMMCWETVITAAVSLICGLAGGILLGKLMFLILLKLLHFDVVLSFAVEPQAMLHAFLLFGAIFLCTLLFNVIQIQKANPVDLLHGGHQGEREPKTKRLLVVIGVLTMGCGYYIAQTTESPLEAIGKFFFAVILVVIGTYSLFTAGSVAVLKALRKNQKFYYQPKHFISVSGMLYRMKQNAVGLANICIMSTVVLVLISVSFSLYAGMEDIMNTRFPKEFCVQLSDSSPENTERCSQIVEEETKAYGMKTIDHVKCRYASFGTLKEEERLLFGEDADISYSSKDYRVLYMIPLKEYNQMEETEESLDAGEVFLYTPGEDYSYDHIEIENDTYQVKKILDSLKLSENDRSPATEAIYVVVPDEAKIMEILEKYVPEGQQQLEFVEFFDLEGDDAVRMQAMESMKARMEQELNGCWAEYRKAFSQEFYTLYGGFLFLGIFVGALFLMATVLIIYYKQISEGYDDRERYQIMQKVGMSKQEVKSSIHSQVLMVFFLPLLVAIIHVAVAFKAMTKLLAVLNLTNVHLFLICTVGIVLIFAVFYGITFLLTSREYYRIVN